MANLKNVIYLSNEDYETLVSAGTVTIDGETLTYDENNVYVTPDKLVTTTEDGLMACTDKVILDTINSAYIKNASVSNNTLTLTKQDGTTVTYTASGDNQKVKAGSVTFGNNDAVDIVAGDNVTVTGLASGTGAPKITISATDTDTGATSVETTGSGNVVNSASYDASTRKLTLSKGVTALTSHQSIKTLDSTATTAQATSSNESIAGDGTITLHKVSKTGNYNDLLNKPTIPTVNNGTLTIQGNGTTASTFTANQSGNTTLNIKGGGNTTVTRSAANEITISSTGGSDTNYYPIRSYTSGLQISTYSGSADCALFVPYAGTSQAGVVEIMTDEEMDAQTGGTSPTAAVNPIVDLIYPVGSIYMSTTDSTVAAVQARFIGTTWVKIKDRFLLADGNIYHAGATGGESSHTLTTSEMPSHSHNIRFNSSNTVDIAGDISAGTGGTWKSVVTGQGLNNLTLTSTGSGSAHNNMPPYYVVYMYRRTA